MKVRPLTRTHRDSAEGSSKGRRGVVLVFFALFFFALFGLFAVVVDWGIVRTTQIQMQTSADVAALTGLAGRDAVLDDIAASDLMRRQEAALFAASVFDEDLDPNTPPDEFILGAGPVLSNGVVSTAMPAGGLLQGDAPWVPALQANVDQNLTEGDLVAGSYVAPGPGDLNFHDEASDYTRLDFTPSSPSGTEPPTAFLARLRRTRDGEPLDRVPGVSSAGPTLPYLFGLGSAAIVPENADLYDPRRDGITVRATSIAEAQPVTMAGMARPGLVGLAPLANDTGTGERRWLTLDQTAWIGVPIDSTVVLTVDAGGNVAGGATGFAALGEARVGVVVAGASVQIASAPPPELAGLVYASLHESDTLRVSGFVALSIEAATVEPGPLLQLTVRKLGATVAPRNASALRSLAMDQTLDPSLPAAAGGLFAASLAR